MTDDKHPIDAAIEKHEMQQLSQQVQSLVDGTASDDEGDQMREEINDNQ